MKGVKKFQKTKHVPLFGVIEKIFKNKIADMVAVSRRFINEPKWLLKDNTKPKKIKKVSIPKQYLRCF